MRSPQTIGDELPVPGTATRHLTFEVGDQVLAYLPGATMPCPEGPRHRGQNLAPSPVTGSIRTSPLCDSSAPVEARNVTTRVRVVKRVSRRHIRESYDEFAARHI